MNNKELDELNEKAFAQSNVIKHSPPKLPLTLKTAYTHLRSGRKLILEKTKPRNKNNLQISISTPTGPPKHEIYPIEEESPQTPEKQSPLFTEPNLIHSQKVSNEPLPRTQLSIQKYPDLPIKTMAQTTDEINSKIINYVPDFRGINSENPVNDLAMFIKRAEWLRDQIEEEQTPIFDQLIQFRLKDDAFTQTHNKKIDDFNTLKRTLHNIYSTTRSLEELQKKCFSCQQKPFETIRQFGHRLLLLLDEYRAGFVSKYNEAPNEVSLKDQTAQAMLTFKKGLRDPRLKREIATMRVGNLEDIILETETVEKLIADTDEDMSILLKATEYVQNTPQYEPKVPSVSCGYCGKPYHTWHECPTRLMQPQSSHMYHQIQKQPHIHKVNIQQHQMRQPAKFCTYCKREGHNVMECRTRRRNNERYKPPQQAHYQNSVYQNPQTFTSPRKPSRPIPQHPSNWAPQTSPPQPIRKNSYYQDRQIICAYCKKIGHKIEECRNKTRFESRGVHQNQFEEDFANKLKIYHIDQSEYNTDHQTVTDNYCQHADYTQNEKPENYDGSDEY